MPKDTLESESQDSSPGAVTLSAAPAWNSAVRRHIHAALRRPAWGVGRGLGGLILLVLEDANVSFSFCLSIYTSLAVLIPPTLQAAIGP